MTISRNLSILAEGVSSSGVLAVTNGGTGVTTSTGTGSTVLSASPTLTGTLTVPTVTSPSATALTIQSAGTTAMTVTTSQYVGIGTTSPTSKLQVNGGVTINASSAPTSGVGMELSWDGNESVVQSYNRSTSSFQPLWLEAGSYTRFGMNGGEAMRIDSSGNVGIGTTSPSSFGKFAVTGSAGTTYVGGGGDQLAFSKGGTNYITTATAGGQIQFQTGAGSNAMLLDSSGNLLVGTTSNVNLEKFNVTGSPANLISRFYNSNASNPNGVGVFYSALSPNGSGNAFFYAADSTALRFNVQSNGGIANYSANNTNLSDERLKKDVQLAGLYLDKICAIPVKTFLYNDQTDNDLNLGVIAQDVNAVAPELVCRDGWKDKDGEPTDYLTIYQTDLQYALMKCIQELSAKNDSLMARVAALEGK